MDKAGTTLHALLVGINDYHREGIRNLKGCLNDVTAMESLLKSYCRDKSKISLHTQTLTNEKATRKAIIKGFEIFNAAKQGDICLFYFSGHGARIKSPKEFLRETDSKLEAIVCHPDRKNGFVIADKELSFLLSKIPQDDTIHTVVITDSCHSGSNTKEINENVRSTNCEVPPLDIDDYHGRKEYHSVKKGLFGKLQLSVPLGKHIKLSACSRNELSKESDLGENGEKRGVFTFALLEALKATGPFVSYDNLLGRTRLITQGINRDQSPQVEVINLPDYYSGTVFLNGILKEQKPTFRVSYDAESYWKVDAGSIVGLQKEDLVRLQDGQLIRVKKVFPGYAELDSKPLQGLDRKPMDCEIVFRSRKKINLGFAPSCSADLKLQIREFLKEGVANHIEVNASRAIHYMIHAPDDFIALTYPGQRIPVFSRIEGTGKTQVRLFIKLIEKVADWHHTISISNPATRITEQDIFIMMATLKKAYKLDSPDKETASEKLFYADNNIFYYHFDESIQGRWHKPYFRVILFNANTEQKFWVSALYCGIWYQYDPNSHQLISMAYSTTNKFLPKEKLEPGKQIKLLDEGHVNGKTYQYESIELSVLDDYFEQGYNEIKDLLKIFVSTDEITTSSLNLKGIPIDTKGELLERPGGQSQHIHTPGQDWRTFDIPITIVRPRELGTLRKGYDISYEGLKILGNGHFTALIILSTMEDFIRSTKRIVNKRKDLMMRPEVMFGESVVEIIPFTTGLGNVEGCSVIELFRVNITSKEKLSEPFVLTVDRKKIKSMEGDLWLMGYDSRQRKYLPLCKADRKGRFELDHLPPSSHANFPGLGNSIKLFTMQTDPHQINFK